MQKLTRVIVVLLFLNFASLDSAMAQGIRTWSSIDCGTWVNARSKGTAIVYETYLVGFIDGFSLGRKTEFWEAGGIPINKEQAFLWMDNYCKENPLSQTITGVYRLFEERLK